ncbi:S8 family serine peptidase [Neolewinella aquimaris]|uniref:S8 family serine peptidase n=1 Tax=Neolewinella aquimaris TaxID=1835722 RepID=UPI00160A2396|nr:S8 family serine peptidase [Neolewinella aquimaris]
MPLISLLLLFALQLSGQRIETELICEWVPSNQQPAGRGKLYSGKRMLAKGVYLLVFADSIATAQAFDRLRADPAVRNVQYNWQVSPRSLPDDPLYVQQSNLARAGFEEAWEVTVGGSSPNGVPIVTAVLDGGFDVGHEDLRNSLWNNRSEVAGDGIDNDGNGFIDDVHGWNFVANAGEYGSDTHGTQVAGLIGAEGDNGIGVAGTNWRSELMLFSITTVADIVAAYEYVISQKSLHLRTAGQMGANVVVTNASFGIEGATCADFPVWGGMYDKLGAVGVLTAASAVNAARDVDLAGDMPTDCPSEYLIGVTNLDQDDRLFSSAGFGSEHVDLGAPGEGSYTTRPNNRYGNFGSTSAAAPYVTGAVALLYATPCASFQNLVATDPSAAALAIRQAILASVDANPSLQFRSSSGGALNVAAAQQFLLTRCVEENPTELILQSVYPNPSSGRVNLITNYPVPDGAQLEVIEILGKEVGLSPMMRSALFPASLEVDLSDWPAGWYLLRLRDGDRTATATLLRQ